MSAVYDRTAVRRALIDVIDGEYEGNETDGEIADRMLAVLDAHLVPPQPHTDPEYGWTAKDWRDWSLKLSALLPEEMDSDEDELSIIETFVRHAAAFPAYPPLGAQRILVERLRQIDEEGYTAEHDRGHATPLIEAARAYLLRAYGIAGTPGDLGWPWAEHLFRPTTPERDLVKAGALIAAAIDAIEADQ